MKRLVAILLLCAGCDNASVTLVFYITKAGETVPALDTRPGFKPVKFHSFPQCLVSQEGINRLPRDNPNDSYTVAKCETP